MDDCLFCKIVAGDLPCNLVCEDEQALAFLDINPIAHGHTLVISRNHYELLEDVPESELGPLLAMTQRVAQAVVKGTGSGGFNLLLSNGACAAQVIPHIHFHIVPRRTGDGLRFVQRREDTTGERQAAILETIRASL